MMVLRPAAIMYICRVHLEPGLGSESKHAPNANPKELGPKKILTERKS